MGVAVVTEREPGLGRVASFDARRGVGEVEGGDGSRYGFHATAIADGSRRIGAGAPVAFALGPGHGGRYEVRSLRPLPSTPTSPGSPPPPGPLAGR